MRRTAALCWLTICLVLMVWAGQASAQAVDDAGLWNALLTQGDFESLGWENEKLNWWFDGHLRYLDDARRI